MTIILPIFCNTLSMVCYYGRFYYNYRATIALEKDRLDKIQEQKDKHQQESQQQWTQKQMQQQINHY
jgi:hypothetical protein